MIRNTHSHEPASKGIDELRIDLRAALAETDDTEARYHIRTALQRLHTIEHRFRTD